MATVTTMRRILEVAVGITKKALQLRLSESIDVQMLYRQAAPDGRYWPLLAGGGSISNLNISLSNINSVTTRPSPAQPSPAQSRAEIIHYLHSTST